MTTPTALERITPTLDDFLPDAPEATGGGELEVLRLSEAPTLVAAFTKAIAEAETHYVDGANLRAEVHCNLGREGRCLLCDVRRPRTHRAILPVYDVSSTQIKALLITDNRQPHALGPQLKAQLRTGDLDKRFLMLTRSGNKFSVQSVPAKEGHDMGEAVVGPFAERLARGQVTLDRAIPVYPNAELWDVPEIERSAEAMGLKRSDYVARGDKTKEAEGR
jgi:hypothetical protein